MEEYEYSFKVSSLEKYIEYCETNGYKLLDKCRQERVIFVLGNTIARITTNYHEEKNSKFLDFKDSRTTIGDLAKREESLALEFSDEKAVLSILDFLGYKKDAIVRRTRTTYQKGEVKFELDDYGKDLVVAIEGEKNQVDKLYQELKEKGEK